jgi:uncharacterized protein (DUF1800 family)
MTPHLRLRQVSSRCSRALLPLAIACLGSFLPASLLALSPVPTAKPAAYPAWWFERDVIPRLNTANPAVWPTNYPAGNDYAAINQGQVKAIITAAVAELNAELEDVPDPNDKYDGTADGVSDGAGKALNDIVYGWSVTPAKGDFTVLNVGQLKSAVFPLYERLIAAGYHDQIPWAYSANADDYAMANAGQLKQLFGFDVSVAPTFLDAVTRDVWTGVSGTDLSTIPLGTTPSSTGSLTTSLESQYSGTNYGERIRGYLTVGKTGVYRFWLTASSSAELYISNDADPVNVFLRAKVDADSGLRGWNHANARKTDLLWLESGRRYYVEVRHKVGTGTGHHVSVLWRQPPTSETQINPLSDPDPDPGSSTPVVGGVAQVVPASALSLSTSALPPAFTPPSATGWTLPTSTSDPDHHSNRNAATRFLIQATFGPSGWKDDVIYGHCGDATHVDGALCTNCGTACHALCHIPGCTYTIDPDGAGGAAPYHPEIHGIHSEACGRWKKFTGSGAPELAGLDPARIPFDVSKVQELGYDDWIDYQIALPKTKLYPYVQAIHYSGEDIGQHQYWHTQFYRAWWRASVTARDQLRQRVAFALSQIMVVGSPALVNKTDATSVYYDSFVEHAFTHDFTDILKDVTLSPAMGLYLNMLRNDKPTRNSSTGVVTRAPNENYARELLQLFSVGLNRMNPDGTLITNAAGQPVPTYDQPTVEGLAHTFTGWGWYYPPGYRYVDTAKGPYMLNFDWGNPYYTLISPYETDYLRGKEPMKEVPARHFTGKKRTLNNAVLPGLPKYDDDENGSTDPVWLDPYVTHDTILKLTKPSSTNDLNKKFNDLAGVELDEVIDRIAAHPNCGPFICRQLIQRLVTSNPSKEYLYRVVAKFNDDGSSSHLRGNMEEVIKAILLDHDARSSDMLSDPTFGKQREPVCRITALARAFPVLESSDWVSTWDMGQTSFVAAGQPNLNQTPLGAPSVFNFYRPDYKFPGVMAKAGMTTPEFQITTATSVLDQANFVNGPFLSWGSPASGKVALPESYLKTICMDFSPWDPTGVSVETLVDRLNVFLMAGQLPSSGTNTYYPTRSIPNVKQAIVDTIVTKPLHPTAGISGPGEPIVLTTTNPHCLTTGDKVFFSHSMGDTAFTGLEHFYFTYSAPYDWGTSYPFNPESVHRGYPVLCHPVTVLSANSFSIPGTRKNPSTVNTNGVSVSLMTYDAPMNRLYYAVNLILNSPDFIIQR